MINDRIYHLINVLKMNPTSFSDSLNVSVTVIFNIIKGRRSKPSYELIHNILKTYDKVNSDWLIKGEGAMWNDDVVTSDKFTPADIDLVSRIKELFIKLSLRNPNSPEVVELEELVLHLSNESLEQKHKLIVLNERQSKMIKMLKEKLKLSS